jgi:hypothetical protein
VERAAVRAVNAWRPSDVRDVVGDGGSVDEAPASPVESLLEAIAHLAAVPGYIDVRIQGSHPDVLAWARERGKRVVIPKTLDVWWDIAIPGEGGFRELSVIDTEREPGDEA